MKKIILTKVYVNYLIKFLIRIAIFGVFLFFYITDKALMRQLMDQSIWHGVTILHVLWLVFMVMMLLHLFPKEKLAMGIRKADKEKYIEQENYSELELLKYVQNQNLRAWIVMLMWLGFNAIFGLLYLFNILDNIDLLMLTVFYFLSDYICILLFCPFQSFIMKNRCCVNCRIFTYLIRF